jgi:hypothetical protein
VATQKTKLGYNAGMKAEVKSDILIGLTHGELAPRAFGRSRGSGRFGHRIIDLDPTKLLGCDLLCLPLKRWNNGGFAFSNPSPG